MNEPAGIYRDGLKRVTVEFNLDPAAQAAAQVKMEPTERGGSDVGGKNVFYKCIAFHNHVSTSTRTILQGGKVTES